MQLIMFLDILFLDKAFESHAYENKAFQIGEGQTISHPYTVAFQTQTLDIKRGDKVLKLALIWLPSMRIR